MLGKSKNKDMRVSKKKEKEKKDVKDKKSRAQSLKIPTQVELAD